MSQEQEIALGQQANVEILREFGRYEDERLQAYVEDIGLSLASVSHRPDLPWRFSVVDSPAVNAFALPGGYIYVTRGLLAYLPDESALAGVLGHEVGHVTARHSVQAYTRSTGAQFGLLVSQVFVPQMRGNPYVPGLSDAAGTGLGLLFLKFGRDDEIQADRLGAEYAADGGWHPEGVGDMLTTLGRISEAADRRGTPNWLSTHPEPMSRVAEVEPVVGELLASADREDWRVNRTGYLEQIDGLRFGDNPDDGIVRGNEFLHPVMRFAMTFPEGWEVMNSDEAVMARQPGTDVYMLLQLADARPGDTLAQVAEGAMREAGYRVRSAGETEINGLEAHIGTYGRQVGDAGEVVARVAYIRSRRSLYAFGGIGPVEAYQEVEREIGASLRSFREMDESEAGEIRPNEVALYTARDGDTWQSIAQGDGRHLVDARTLAIMNGYPVNEQPRPGDRLKVVVEGRESASGCDGRRLRPAASPRRTDVTSSSC